LVEPEVRAYRLADTQDRVRPQWDGDLIFLSFHRFTPLANRVASVTARAVPFREVQPFQWLAGTTKSRVRNSRQLPGPRVGNFHLMLQVRYCTATLIIDERMQIL
jgi:hypothetical protein